MRPWPVRLKMTRWELPQIQPQGEGIEVDVLRSKRDVLSIWKWQRYCQLTGSSAQYLFPSACENGEGVSPTLKYHEWMTVSKTHVEMSFLSVDARSIVSFGIVTFRRTVVQLGALATALLSMLQNSITGAANVLVLY
jgi:hypothetical protein